MKFHEYAATSLSVEIQSQEKLQEGEGELQEKVEDWKFHPTIEKVKWLINTNYTD